MKLGTATITGSRIHTCKQYMEYTLTVSGDDTSAQMREGRFVLESFFAVHTLTWKAHGTRIKRCPTCGKGLPASIESVDESDFLSKEER